MTEKSKEYDLIDWKEKGDFRYRKGLSAAMISPNGEVILEKNRLLGQARNIPKKMRKTRYGSDYCVAKLAREFIQPLAIADKEVLLKLINEAWNYYLWDEQQGRTLSDRKKQKQI